MATGTPAFFVLILSDDEILCNIHGRLDPFSDLKL